MRIMKTTTTATPTAPHVSAADVTRAAGKCVALCLEYALQCTARGMGMVQRAAMGVCQWLSSPHNFADKEEPVTLTGWQFIGFGALVMFASVVLSIQW